MTGTEYKDSSLVSVKERLIYLLAKLMI